MIRMQKSKDEIRKEKNRLSANLSYQKKKREREDLENKNRTLSNTQLSLHRDMRRLRKLARCYEAVLSEIVHINTCTLSRPVDRHAMLLPVSSSLAPQNHRSQPAKDESVPTAFFPASPVLRGGGEELPRVLDEQNKLGEETGVTLCSKPQQICMNVPNISLLSDELEWGQVASHSSPQGLGGKVLTPPSSQGSRFELTSRSSDPCDELNDFKFKSLPVPNPQRLPLLSTIPPTVPHFLVEFQASLRTDENFTSGFSSMTDVNQVFTTFNEKETEPRFREKSTNTPQPTLMITSATTTMKTRNDGAANTWKAFPYNARSSPSPGGGARTRGGHPQCVCQQGPPVSSQNNDRKMPSISFQVLGLRLDQALHANNDL
ncbi:uncharacterized protein LOC112566637 isoform X3 [Pomacea canaliculata]|uniref:uncharacterized protein LOC112566637 isoform X3 n=1 Tax=Pomacea canaliculata TaxID=400727 RepID=UPI000D733A51|nr:uncharacterized protein LOC112566637 isoform X3 [Pomacea canaliculata]